MERIVNINRDTKETQISMTLNLDGSGKNNFECPIGFMSHLLDALCKHGLFDLSGTCKGDLEVDQHHLIEDLGIVLGSCFAKALGDCAGIFRSGSNLFAMDETLARAAVDFGGRSFLVCVSELSNIPLVSISPNGKESSFQTDCFDDFWQGFVSTAKCALHLDTLRGRNDHHKMEALFKAAGRALRQAVEIDARRNGAIPSTKGVIV